MTRRQAIALLSAPAALAHEWTPLFDGRTLKGWSVAAQPEDARREFWRSSDGLIVCDSRGRKDHDYVWLISDREFADFELELQVRGHPETSGNSGVQVRSRYDWKAHWLDGPQVDIHPPGPWRTGLIYDETRESKRWIFPSRADWRIEPEHGPKDWRWNASGWNTLRVTCRGTRITTEVNGLRIADLDGRGLLDDEAHRRYGVGLKGHIALQLHRGDEILIEYKDIRIRPAG